MRNQPNRKQIGLGERLRASFGPRKDYYRGLILKESGETTSAAEAFGRQTAADPRDASAAAEQIHMLLQSGETEQAVRVIWASLRRMPNDPQLLRMRATVYGAIGGWDLALDDLVASNAFSDNAGLGSIVRALINLRRLDSAQSLLEPIKCPTIGFAYFLGEIYRLKGDEHRSQLNFAKVVEGAARVLPQHPEMRGLYGVSYVHLGRDEEAKALIAARYPAGRALLDIANAILAVRRGDLNTAYASLATDQARSSILVEWLSDPIFSPVHSQKRFRRLLVNSRAANQDTRENLLRYQPQ